MPPCLRRSVILLRPSSRADNGLKMASLGPNKAKVHAIAGAGLLQYLGLNLHQSLAQRRILNTQYIIEALARFLMVFKQKRLPIARRDWWVPWENSTMHTLVMATNWMAAWQFKIIQHTLYSLDLALADFFLLPKVKREPAGLTLTQETLKKERERAVRTLSAVDLALAFRQ